MPPWKLEEVKDVVNFQNNSETYNMETILSRFKRHGGIPRVLLKDKGKYGQYSSEVQYAISKVESLDSLGLVLKYNGGEILNLASDSQEKDLNKFSGDSKPSGKIFHMYPIGTNFSKPKDENVDYEFDCKDGYLVKSLLKNCLVRQVATDSILKLLMVQSFWKAKIDADKFKSALSGFAHSAILEKEICLSAELMDGF